MIDPVEPRSSLAPLPHGIGAADLPCLEPQAKFRERGHIDLGVALERGVDIASRLATAADATYEPTWDTDRGEFTWGFGLREEHPRGQFNAIMAAAEAMSPGAWTALTTSAPSATSPGEVVGVDFPTVALRRAEWVDGSLQVTTVPVNDAVVIVNKIRGGQSSDRIIIGPAGFLGVAVQAVDAATATQLSVNGGALLRE